jgi:hypothetical protein
MPNSQYSHFLGRFIDAVKNQVRVSHKVQHAHAGRFCGARAIGKLLKSFNGLLCMRADPSSCFGIVFSYVCKYAFKIAQRAS